MQYFENVPKKTKKRRERNYISPDEAKGFQKFIILPRKIKLAIYAGILLVLFLITLLAFNIWAGTFFNTENVKAINQEQKNYLSSYLMQSYPEKYRQDLQKLPYAILPAKLNIWASSAIIFDFSNGCILFEKNPDAKIPPASITKIFVMYLVFEDIKAGKITLNDIVPLPERSWAVNLPRDASKMFIGQGQTVTLRELLTGLAVASGNDAAIAVATYLNGSPAAFIERMNTTCQNLGLQNTHFVDTSGYDEHNITTPRELAKFAYLYMKKHSDLATQFHSTPSILYPLEKNLPSWQKKYGDSKAIFQENTNPLLGQMEGCDGIKTGFIYESGYNLALTAKRGNERFISITMNGPGKNTKEGNEGRVHDGTELMEWAFSSFADYSPANETKTDYAVPTPGTTEKFVKLVPAWSETISVPHIAGANAQETVKKVKAEVSIPKFIYGEVTAGRIYGQIQYKLDDIILQTVPLVADRNLESSGKWGRFWGKLAALKINSKTDLEFSKTN